MVSRLKNRKLIYGILFVIVFLIIMAYQYSIGTAYLDSDMSSEMVLAKLLNEEGTLMSKNWFYSTELRVFCESNLLKFGLFVFPHNWHAARVLVKGITLLIMAIVFYIFGKKIELGDEAILGAIVLICPFGFWQAFHSVFGPFYTSHMIYLTLIYYLILVCVNSEKKPVVAGVFLVIVSFVAGLSGIRNLLMIFVPAAFTAVLMYYFKARATKKLVMLDSFEGKAVIACVIGTLANVVGCVINFAVLSKIYFVGAMDKTWAEMSLTELTDRWMNFLELFGYPDAGRHIPVLSFLGIVCGGFGIALAGYVIITIARLWLRRENLNNSQRYIFGALLSTLLIAGMSFSFMEGVGGGNGSYWLPMVPLMVGVAIIEAKSERFSFAYTRNVLAVVLLLSIFAVSYGNTKIYLNTEFRHPMGIETPVKWLQDNGYTEGYATFWNANVITEMTNGEIDMWAVKSLDTLEVMEWLQRKSHVVERPQEHFFIISYGEENETQLLNIENIPNKLAYEDENGYRIYVFDNAEELAGYISVQ